MTSVSIVTPSLNQGRFLADALDSVIAQAYPEVEHLVVEGGSTDESVVVLEHYAEHPHLRVIEDVPPRGQSAAVNVGFRAATGEIVGWLNADDRYCGGAIAASVEALESGEAALSYGDWQIVDEQGELVRSLTSGSFDRRRLLAGVSGTIAQPTVFFRRELLDRIGYLDESLDFVMDYDFWLRASEVTQFRYVSRTLAQFRVHPESKTVSRRNSFYAERRRVARAHGGAFFSAGLVRQTLETVFGRRVANHLVWHWTGGADADAGRHSERADGMSPRCPLCRRGLLGGRP